MPMRGARHTMMYIKPLLLIFAVWAIGLSPASLGEGGQGGGHSRKISRQEAAAIAKQRGNGRILSLDRSDQGGREHYRAKVLSRRGVVSTIRIDRDSGDIAPPR